MVIENHVLDERNFIQVWQNKGRRNLALSWEARSRNFAINWQIQRIWFWSKILAHSYRSPSSSSFWIFGVGQRVDPVQIQQRAVNSYVPKINKKEFKTCFCQFRVARKCLLKQLSGLSRWKFSCLFDRSQREEVSHSLNWWLWSSLWWDKDIDNIHMSASVYTRSYHPGDVLFPVIWKA